MNFDIMEIGAEIAEEFRMDTAQTTKEVEYKMSIKLLEILKRRGIITHVEYAQIDALNRQSFSPSLSKVYV
ncbi:SHOCT domain-containing protein [Faecalispora anaeroviscerum]|uniref:SHOCT domain-containing protein n=1 Tax=Faecalispora anaeroviscerum TaxID=2991836 RepID=UPI0024B92214|nr:SHOCT domain-containing protein [Faecalispora anaeroviscerum]